VGQWCSIHNLFPEFLKGYDRKRSFFKGLNTWFDIIGMIEKLQGSFLVLQKFYKV